ncbi:MAG: DUF2189 domain-containing protein [Rhodospirillales bacterium]|nr:DUF2189 domain-containing protein [Rhodospirillales bacterium]
MNHRAYSLPVGIRTVSVDRSGYWLAAGWQDFLQAPVISIVYGGAFALLSIVLGYGVIAADLGSLVLPLAGGFVLLAPILVVGLYDVSRRLESGHAVGLHPAYSAFRENIGQLSAMGIVLMFIWFIWVEVAIFLFAIVYNRPPPPLENFILEVPFTLEGALLLSIGTLLGAGFALVIFAVTAVSIPMMFDRRVDVVTAIGASILTVRANWQVMFGWAALIALVTACGIATFGLGLAVALPVLAYATWHCYRDLIAPPHQPHPTEPASAPLSDAI